MPEETSKNGVVLDALSKSIDGPTKGGVVSWPKLSGTPRNLDGLQINNNVVLRKYIVYLRLINNLEFLGLLRDHATHLQEMGVHARYVRSDAEFT